MLIGFKFYTVTTAELMSYLKFFFFCRKKIIFFDKNLKFKWRVNQGIGALLK